MSMKRLSDCLAHGINNFTTRTGRPSQDQIGRGASTHARQRHQFVVGCKLAKKSSGDSRAYGRADADCTFTRKNDLIAAIGSFEPIQSGISPPAVTVKDCHGQDFIVVKVSLPVAHPDYRILAQHIVSLRRLRDFEHGKVEGPGCQCGFKSFSERAANFQLDIRMPGPEVCNYTDERSLAVVIWDADPQHTVQAFTPEVCQGGVQ